MLKRKRDRLHKKLYRATGLGKEQRKREVQKKIPDKNHTTYMRYWRKADPKKRARQERLRSRRYYEKHKAEILLKHKMKRKAKKQLKATCSH